MLDTASPAKINLFLEVTEKRPDAFHNIETVLVEIDLADRLAVEPAEAEITLACDSPDLVAGAGNLVVKAAETLKRAAGVRAGAHFHLEKRIPMGSGLGGGSSNAGAALRLANRLWDTGLPENELAAIGATVGSDVPFFLYGGTCLCRGKGEIVESLPHFPENAELGLVLSGIHSDTAEAYRGLALPSPKFRRRADSFMAALAAGDIPLMASRAFNRFEDTIFLKFPFLADVQARLREAGVAARLSGSGSALWFFGSAERARDALAGLEGVEVLAARAFSRHGERRFADRKRPG